MNKENITSKICTLCNIEKEFEEFHTSKNGKYGYNSQCKDCVNAKGRKFKTDNREAILTQRKQYNIDNKDKRAEDRKRDIVRTRQTKQAREVQRCIEDEGYRITRNIRKSVQCAFMSNQNMDVYHELLGCTPRQARRHVEEQWEFNMTWDNYGTTGWHVDHIKPLASFDLTDVKQQKECFHYSNTQPLWAHDNMSKGSRV